MKNIVFITLFAFTLTAFAQSCPYPYKESDLYCHLIKIAVEEDDNGYDAEYDEAPRITQTSIPINSPGVINQITQGPNNYMDQKRCAFKRLASSLQEKEIAEDEERIEEERRDWYQYQGRNEIRPNATDELSETARRQNQSEAPSNSDTVNVELKNGDPEVDGFYRYGPVEKKFGTEKTIWQIEEAGKKLAQDGLVMGVGNISKDGGGSLYPPHTTHKSGKNVDLRFLNSEGIAKACTYQDSSCYNREKTKIMLETIINVDPTNVKSLIVNDPILRREMKEDFPNIHFTEWAGHDDHVHLTLK